MATFGVRVSIGVGDSVAVALSATVGDVVGVDDGAGVCVAELRATAFGPAVRATGVGVCTTTTGEWLGSGVGIRRAANADKSAPIPSPAMMTPAKSGTMGKAPRSSSSGDERRRRGGSVGPELIAGAAIPRTFTATWMGKRASARRQRPMVRVPVPIDLGTAVTAGATAFALATPIRAVTLLELAIARVLGRRAPADKRDRTLRATLAGLRAGTFSLHIDGRQIDDPERVIVCSGSATLRFFARRSNARLVPSTTTE